MYVRRTASVKETSRFKSFGRRGQSSYACGCCRRQKCAAAHQIIEREKSPCPF